ncbi:MAG: NAD(+) synthase [Bacteroidales bacterium]|nr:NAD(+) synthase [Bacteroidales bacterium]
MKISVLQDAFFPGAWEENFKKISDFYKKACREKADLAVIPTDALCGFEPKSLLEYTECSDKIARLQKKLVRETTRGTALVFDTPFALDGSFIPSLCAAWDGCIQFSVNQFPECEGGLQGNMFEFKDTRILVAYLSSLFMLQAGSDVETLREADMGIFLDARAFMAESEKDRARFVSQLAAMFGQMLYVAQSGGQACRVLTGASAYYRHGECCLQYPYFKAYSSTFDTEDAFKPVRKTAADKEIALIHDAIVCGIRDYFKHNGIKKAVIGLSGGIDSAVVLPLAVEALGRQNVFGMMMPSQFSTDHSVNDAVQEAENLQIYYEIIPIEPLYKTFMKQLSPVFKGTPFGLAEENLQARIRGNLLMAAANKTGAMLLNTSNKSESACGYGTMYGDLCGGMSVIGDLYKSQVYALAHYINRKKEVIPQNCIDKAPSAELRPGQKDSDSLPPYDTIEKILRLHLEEKKDEKEIIKEGVDKEITRKVLDLFYKNAYKRRQTPPVIRLSNTVLAEDTEIPAAYKRSR